MNISAIQRLKSLLFALAVVVCIMPLATHAAGSLVIDEFQLSNKDSDYNEYFIIKNYSSTEYPMIGLEFRKITAGGTRSLLVTFDRNLEAGHSFVISHSKSIYAAASDYTYSNTSFRADSSVYIYNPNSDPKIVDLVAFGDYATSYNEGISLPNPSKGDIYTRTDGLDSNDNYTDFSLRVELPVIDPNANKLLISELVPNPNGGDEWFELYNPTTLDISLANLKICDALGATHCYYFAQDEIIQANSYKVYYQSTTKITLNNNGDWLELYDVTDNLLTDSGGDYGDADKGISLALFGTDYQWTKTLTPAVQNVFTDIIEIETDVAATSNPKASKAKIKTAAKKTVVTTNTSDNNPETVITSESETKDTVPSVKAAESSVNVASNTTVFDHKKLGWGLIGLAILLLVGYTCWYFRAYAKNIYDKIKSRNDSARF